MPGPIDVDVHVPTVDEVTPNIPGVTVDVDTDLDEIGDKLKKVHDFFSPFADDDDAAQRVLKRYEAALVELQQLAVDRAERRKRTKNNLVIGFVVGMLLGRGK